MQQFNFYFLTVIVFPVLLFLSAQPVAAHPHVFIVQDTKIVFDEKGLAGFKIYWAFDEMFSVMIAEDFDKDQNGTLGEQEVATIKEKAFSYIAPHNYYIHIKIEGNPFAVKFITDFNATLNTGMGIPRDALPRIFDRFYRTDQSPSLPGNGLGLSLAMAFAKAHNGTIGIISSPNQGTTCTFSLPVSAINYS